jgi:hypothetical protein
MSAAVAGTIPGLNGELHHYYRLDPGRSLLPPRQDATQRHLFRISTRLQQALRGSTRCRS